MSVMKTLKQDSVMSSLLNPAIKGSQHPFQGCLLLASLWGGAGPDPCDPDKLPTFAPARHLPMLATLPAAAHHVLCLAGCTYTGRIFYNNETFPSVLDPCLSCICLVCTTQSDPNPQHQLPNPREGSLLVLGKVVFPQPV